MVQLKHQHRERIEMDQPDDLLLIDEVAERLRLSKQSLRVMRHRGSGPKSFIVGRRLRWLRGDVEKWILQQREKDASAA